MNTKQKGINRVLKENLTDQEARDLKLLQYTFSFLNIRITESRLIIILKSFID